MKIQLVILDAPIIVSDERIKEGDNYYSEGEIYLDCEDSEAPLANLPEQNCKKIIAGIEGLPLIDWNGLEEEFGWIDVEKLAKIHAFNWYEKEDRVVGRDSYTEGFKKAQSLNGKKFSLEDMKKAMFKVYKNGIRSPKEGKQSFNEILNEIIKSLQQPKVFDIEVEVEYGWDSSGGKHSRPKITNNSVKIIRKL